MIVKLSLAVLALIEARPALAGPAPTTAVIPRAAYAELVGFEDRLDANDSATEVLRQWCADHGLAHPAVIRAVRVRDADKPADDEVRRALSAGDGRPLRYRRVQLTCGTRVLSEADNWYRPDTLDTDMNRRLDESDTPFGVVVRPLNFHRRTLRVQWLVAPSRGGDAAGASALPHELLRHVAVLTTCAGTPFSLVVETYTSEVLTSGSDLSR